MPPSPDYCLLLERLKGRWQQSFHSYDGLLGWTCGDDDDDGCAYERAFENGCGIACGEKTKIDGRVSIVLMLMMAIV